MGFAAMIVVYFTMNKQGTYETPLAKRTEFLNGKRSQNSLCAPSYKEEIKRLGNESEFVFTFVIIRARDVWKGL